MSQQRVLLIALLAALQLSLAAAACTPLSFKLRSDGGCPLTFRQCADFLQQTPDRITCSKGELALSIRYSIMGFLISSTYSHLQCVGSEWQLPTGIQYSAIESIGCVLPMPCQECAAPRFLTESEVAASPAAAGWTFAGTPDIHEEMYSKCSIMSCKRTGGTLVELKGTVSADHSALQCSDAGAWEDRADKAHRVAGGLFCGKKN